MNVGASGAGELTVSGGTVQVGGTLKTWNGGQLTINSGTVTVGLLVNNAGATFSHTGGTLTVDGGSLDQGGGAHQIVGSSATAIVQLTNGANFSPASLTLGGATAGDNGSLFVSGSTLTIGGGAGSLLDGGDGTSQLYLNGTVTLNLDDITVDTIFVASTSDATYHQTQAGRVVTADTLRIGNSRWQGTYRHGDGSAVISGETFVGIRGRSSDPGALIIEGGTFDTSELTVGRYSSVTLSDGLLRAGTIAPERVGFGTFDFLGGELSVDDMQMDLLQQNGTLAAGDSPGTTILQAYAINSGTLEVEIDWDGATAPVGGIDFDLYTADSVDLDGDDPNDLNQDGLGASTLEVVLLPGTAANLEEGDSFEFLTFTPGNAGGTTGVFDVLSLPALGDDLHLVVSYNFGAGNATLTVVPEPSAFALAALGMVVACGGARRRRKQRG